MSVAGVIAFVVCYFTINCVETQFATIILKMPEFVYEILKISVIGILCLAVYTILNLLMKMEYASELTKRVTERFKK